MKFIISQSALIKALTLTGKAIKDNTVMPILETYRFKITDGILEITGSSMEVFITKRIKIDAAENVSIAIPSGKLLDIINKLPDQPLTFEVTETKVDKAKSFGLKITYSNGKCDMSVEDGDDFPDVKPGSDIVLKLDSELLLGCINKTLFAVGKDELRPAITGVLLNIENKVATFTGTNATLLSTFDMPLTQEDKSVSIVPAKVLGILQGVPLQKTVEVSISKKNIKFDIDEDTTIISVLIDEKFPDYKGIIPDGNDNVLTINKDELLSAIGRVSVFSNEKTALVRLELGDEIKLFGGDEDFKRNAEETLTGLYAGDEMSIGLSAKLLMQAISKLKTDEVHFSLSKPNTAILFRENNSKRKMDLMLLMPMMLNHIPIK